jgi:sulfur carrier protein
VTVIVNGQPAEVDQGQTVAGLLARLGHPPGGPGIAVALNGEVVPRSAWPTTGLDTGDRVEVLGASQGG